MTQIIVREGLVIDDPIEAALLRPNQDRRRVVILDEANPDLPAPDVVLKLLRSGTWHLHDLLGGDPSEMGRDRFERAIQSLLALYNNMGAGDRERGLDLILAKAIEEAHASRRNAPERKGRVWVEPYVRDGERVEGYWRRFEGVLQEGVRIVVPDDASSYGEPVVNARIQQGGGSPVRGAPIPVSDPRIPETLYHVTTNKPAVLKAGYLRAGGVGGLGGDKGDRIVSLTIDKKTAEQLVKDLKFVASLYKAGDPPPYEWDDEKKRWVGDRTEWSQAVVEALEKEAKRYGFEMDASSWADIQRRSYKIGDYLRQFFAARQSKTDAKDPILFSADETFSRVDPDAVGMVEIPRDSLRTGALLTDFDLGRRGLEEVRVYGDVPLTPGPPAPRSEDEKLVDSLYQGAGKLTYDAVNEKLTKLGYAETDGVPPEELKYVEEFRGDHEKREFISMWTKPGAAGVVARFNLDGTLRYARLPRTRVQQAEGIKARTWVKPYLRADGTRVRGYWHVYAPVAKVGDFQIGDLVTVGDREQWNDKDEYDALVGKVGRVVAIEPDSEWPFHVQILEQDPGGILLEAPSLHIFKSTHIAKFEGGSDDDALVEKVNRIREQMGEPLSKPPHDLYNQELRKSYQPLLAEQRAEVVAALQGLDRVMLDDADARNHNLELDGPSGRGGRASFPGEYVRNKAGLWVAVRSSESRLGLVHYESADRTMGVPTLTHHLAGSIPGALTDEEFAAQYRGPLRSALGLGEFAFPEPTTEEIIDWIRVRGGVNSSFRVDETSRSGLPLGWYIRDPGNGMYPGWHRYDSPKDLRDENDRLVPGEEFSEEHIAVGHRGTWIEEMKESAKYRARESEEKQAAELLQESAANLNMPLTDYELEDKGPGRLYQEQMHKAIEIGAALDDARWQRILSDAEWQRLDKEIYAIRAATEELRLTGFGRRTAADRLQGVAENHLQEVASQMLEQIDPVFPGRYLGRLQNSAKNSINLGAGGDIWVGSDAGYLIAEATQAHERAIQLQNAPDPLSYFSGENDELHGVAHDRLDRALRSWWLSREEIGELAALLEWESDGRELRVTNDAFWRMEDRAAKILEGEEKQADSSDLRDDIAEAIDKIEHYANSRVRGHDDAWLHEHGYLLAAGDRTEMERVREEAKSLLTARVNSLLLSENQEEARPYREARAGLQELIPDITNPSLRDAEDRIRKLRGDKSEREAQAIRDTLAAVGVEVGGETINLDFTRRSKGVKSVESASAYYPNSWIAHSNTKPKARVKQDAGDAGGEYTEHDRLIRTDGSVSTSTHELCHHLEYGDRALGSAEWTFWHYRARGRDFNNPLPPLEEAMPWKKKNRGLTCTDEFKDRYAGRVYHGGDWGVFWEILSNGIPALFRLSRDNLVWNDPEYRHFVLGVMATIRPEAK